MQRLVVMEAQAAVIKITFWWWDKTPTQNTAVVKSMWAPLYADEVAQRRRALKVNKFLKLIKPFIVEANVKMCSEYYI